MTATSLSENYTNSCIKLSLVVVHKDEHSNYGILETLNDKQIKLSRTNSPFSKTHLVIATVYFLPRPLAGHVDMMVPIHKADLRADSAGDIEESSILLS